MQWNDIWSNAHIRPTNWNPTGTPTYLSAVIKFIMESWGRKTKKKDIQKILFRIQKGKKLPDLSIKIEDIQVAQSYNSGKTLLVAFGSQL